MFQGFVNKGKSMFNTKKERSNSATSGAGSVDEDGFESGEDDDLIEIGKHKGAAVGANSVF